MSHKILVTGGAGYIGSMLVPALLEAGHAVTVVDNFMFRQNSLASVCASPRFDVVNDDVRKKEVMAPLLAAHDVVIPLAALVGAPLCAKDPFGATSTNKTAVYDMLALLGDEQRILMPTTNSGYGVGEEGIYCTEETPLRPLSQYGKEKVEVEERVLARRNSISFRLATVFGMSPKMRLDLLVNDFVYRAVNDRAVVLFESSFKRNYIHVRDVVGAFLHGIDNFDTMRGEAYNVGLSDANLSKAELCERIRRHLPDFVFMDAPIGKDIDQRNYIVSNEKIEATGFAPAHSLDFGVQELIKGYRMLRNSVYANV
jgi:nucleoside-diphosphate-sugar epimerase